MFYFLFLFSFSEFNDKLSQVLRQEKRHLQSIISNIEADVMELEVNKVNSETRAVLFDIQDNTDVMEGEFSDELLGLSSGEEKTGSGGGSGKRGTCWF